MSKALGKKIRDIDESQFGNNKTLGDKIKFVLQYAILAPSTHNVQPWFFLVGDDYCDIVLDNKCELPQADKDKRNAYISIGCALENIIYSAQFFGIYNNYKFIRDDELKIRVYFKDGGAVSGNTEYISAVKNRINVRGIFSTKEISKNFVDDIVAKCDEYGVECSIIKDKGMISDIAILTKAGIVYAYNNKLFRKEMSHFINHSYSRKNHGIHGYSLKLPVFLSFLLSPAIRFFNIGFLLKKLNYRSVNSADTVCVFSTDKDVEEEWVTVGRAAQFAMLYATKNNFNTSIYIASIENSETRQQLQKIVGMKKKPQFLITMGYMPGLHHTTPRIPLKYKLKDV
ncbi:MAG: hypothetical protein Q8P20_05840 [bacterium]|nr:hypothetical protein [bacterium]